MTKVNIQKMKRLTALRKMRGKDRFPIGFREEDVSVGHAVKPYTKTSRERISAMIRAVQRLRDPGSRRRVRGLQGRVHDGSIKLVLG